MDNWTVSTDGLTWTFKLKQGVKFHDGSELKAEDVAFSMDRLLTIGQGYAFEFLPYVNKTTALDDYTVEFKLNKSWGPMLNALTLFFVVNKDVVMAHIADPSAGAPSYGEFKDYATTWLATHDAGSGPYKVKSFITEASLTMEVFTDYFEEILPNAPEEVIFSASPGAATVKTMMAKRELEIAGELPREVNEYLETITGIKAGKIFFGDQVTLSINTRRPPTDDVHFRRAMAYAFNYTAGAQIFAGAVQSKGPVSQEIPGHDPNIFVYDMNLAKAQEELQQSKYASNYTEYEVEVAWCAEVADEEKVSILFANCMQQLGINVKVTKVPWLSMIELAAIQESTPNMMCFLPCTTYGEAASILNVKFHSEAAGSCYGCSWLLNDTIDQMLEDALSTVDQDERFAKYANIQAELQQLCTEINVCDMPMIQCYQDHYVDWPTAEGQAPPDLCYNIECRLIQVYPEKRQELL